MKKLLLMKTMLLLCALIAGSGTMWATLTSPYSYTWTASNSPNGSVALGNATWNFTYTWKSSSYYGYDGTKGQQ